MERQSGSTSRRQNGKLAAFMKRKRTVRGNVSKGAIRRLARRGGVKRISALIYDEARDVLERFVKRLLKDSIIYCEYAKRKTVMAEDVVRAFRNYGQRLYGFDERPFRFSKRSSARVTEDSTQSSSCSTSAGSQIPIRRTSSRISAGLTGGTSTRGTNADESRQRNESSSRIERRSTGGATEQSNPGAATTDSSRQEMKLPSFRINRRSTGLNTEEASNAAENTHESRSRNESSSRSERGSTSGATVQSNPGAATTNSSKQEMQLPSFRINRRSTVLKTEEASNAAENTDDSKQKKKSSSRYFENINIDTDDSDATEVNLHVSRNSLRTDIPDSYENVEIISDSDDFVQPTRRK